MNAVKCNLTKLTMKRGAARYVDSSPQSGHMLGTTLAQGGRDCKHGVLGSMAMSVG